MKINDIDIIIQRKNIKNMYLRVVPPEGTVKISAPHHVSDEQIIDFIYSKMDWIIEKRAKIAEGKYLPKLKYVNGEKHPLWGEEYDLQLIANNIKVAIILTNITLFIIYLASKLRFSQAYTQVPYASG